jgi:PST family polysaccharide transporter
VFLVQRHEEPTDVDLSVVVSLQFGLYLALQIGAIAAIAFSSRLPADKLLWELLSVAVCALPFGVVRSGSMIVLERKLDFSKMAMIEVTEQVVTTIVMVGLAFAGARAWSVVIGGVGGAIVSWRLAYRMAPYRLRLQRPRLTPALRAGLSYSAQVLAPSLIGTARIAAIPIVLGGMIGLAAVGFAERATFIATLPASLLGGIQQKILFSYTSRIQRNQASVRRVIEEATYASATLDKFLYIPLAAFAPAIIHHLLTDKWLPAAPLVQVMAWVGAAATSFQGAAPPVLNAVGQARVIAILNVAMLVLTWVLLVPLVHWAGLMGYAYLSVVLYLTVPYLYYLMRRHIGEFRIMRSLLSSFAGFALTVVALRAAAAQWTPAGPTLPQLVAFCAVGTLFYGLLMVASDWRRFRLITSDLRRRIGARRLRAVQETPSRP